MKRIKFLIMSLSIIIMSAVLTSCEGIDGSDNPVFNTLIIHLEYDGLEDFQGELSRIAIFITDENGNFIVRHADKIDENMFAADVKPGKYIVSAEYIESEANADNIILGSAQVKIKEYQVLEIPLKINLNKIQTQNNK